MKKNIALLLAVILTLSVCACGTETPAREQGTDVPPMLTAAPGQSSGEGAVEQGSAVEPENEAKAQAEKLVGKSIADLIAALGEPLSSSYAPSCLGSGEDGEYIYDGFTVYTYKENGTELVRSVG